MWGLGRVRTLIQINQHDHGGVHWLVVSGPGPLKGLEVWVSGKENEFSHETMTVAKGTVIC